MARPGFRLILRRTGTSRSSTWAGRPRRRAPTCWPNPSSARTRPIRGFTCCSRAAVRRRMMLASASATAPRFLGWLRGDDLARAYASADIFLFCSRTDTFGQVLVEAGPAASPVVAVDEGGPRSIVVDGETGRLCEPDSGDARRRRCSSWRRFPGVAREARPPGPRGGQARTWEASMAQLAAVTTASPGGGGADHRLVTAAWLRRRPPGLCRRSAAVGSDRRARPADDGIERTGGRRRGNASRPKRFRPGGRTPTLRPLALLQPRALLARLQRPGPPAGGGSSRSRCSSA